MRHGHGYLMVAALSVAALTAQSALAQPATIVGVDGTFACVLGATDGPGSWLPTGNAPLSIGDALVPITLAGRGAPLTVSDLGMEPEVCSKTRLVTFAGEGMPSGFVAMPDFTGDASVTRLAPDQAAYRTAVVDALAALGLPNAEPHIVQLLRTDLESDGRDEIVIVAERGDKLQPRIEAGDYALVLVRRLDASGAVQTVTLAQEVYTEGADFAAPSQYRIHAIADLDGDGTREIVMGSRYYEGAGVSIIGIAPDGTSTMIAGCACGA